MANNLNIKTNASKVENEKTKSQNDELAVLKKLKEETDKKAKEESNKKKDTTLNTSSKKTNNDLAKAIVKGTKATISNGFNFIKGIIVGIIIGVVLCNVFGFGNILDTVNDGKDKVDQIIDQNFIGYTALDFENAILGAASEHQELIVMEQPIQIETTVTKSGLGNLEIFSKVKNITYSGNGVYTVDMSKINKESINVDFNSETITITIPHTVLQYVNLDLDNVKFEDTEKGLLAFGDLSLTSEQVNEIERNVKASMNEKLDNAELYKQADEFATLKTWQIFQPLINSIASNFVVEMVFDK